MDAAEIAVLVQGALRGDKVAMSCILDALEQARKEREDYTAMMREAIVYVREQRDQAQKDAKDARALLAEAMSMPVHRHTDDLRARIEAMLEQKP